MGKKDLPLVEMFCRCGDAITEPVVLFGNSTASSSVSALSTTLVLLDDREQAFCDYQQQANNLDDC